MEARRLLGIIGLLATVCMASAETREWLTTAHSYAVQVNQLRLQYNLPPLKLNAQLCEAAQTHAETLAQTGMITHVDAHGRRADYRASEAGYFYHRLGENLAAGQLTWERALHAWLNSPDHRANLLTPDYRELGIGFAGSATRYRTVWAQLLGARRTAYPVIINLDAYATDTPEVAVYVHGAREARAMRYRINDGAWSAWQSSTEWLECELPHREGFHTITVQIRIGSKPRTRFTYKAALSSRRSRATASATTHDAPASLRARAQASSVLPVVNTSSSSHTARPRTRLGHTTSNASRTFFSRSA
jgi:hypothetical protein